VIHCKSMKGIYYPSSRRSYILFEITECNSVDHPCGLVVRAPGYRTEMYCASYEVRSECIYVM
jgi:hypothetical protein